MALFLKKSLSVPLRISLPPITHSNFQSKGTSRCSGWRTEDEIKTLFDEWTIEYERTYTGVEREERFQIWRNTLRIVEEHNNTGCPSWRKGLTLFSDVTYEEFMRRQKKHGRRRRIRPPHEPELQPQEQQQQQQKETLI